MAQGTSVLLLMLSCTVIFSSSLVIGQEETDNSYVQDACSVTHYQDLCIHSLSPFANTAKRSPTRWARAAVSVTIGGAKNVTRYLVRLQNRKGDGLKGRNKAALADCVETIGETLDNLHKALFILRELSAGEFFSQIEDVTTWVSAALTDEETCLDGFEEQKGRRIRSLKNRVSNVSYLTSNALAIVNKLATAGPDFLKDEGKLG